MNRNRTNWLPVAVSAALCIGGLAATGAAQVAEMPHRQVDMLSDSGVVWNQGVVEGADGGNLAPEVVWSDTITVQDASWSRLMFGEVMLSGSERNNTDSYLRITSLIDGADQFLNARTVQEWSFTSARFRGGQLLVELVAYPGTGPNRVQINGVWAGDLEPNPQIETQCGAFDNRTPSNDPRNARVSPVGCSAWLIDTPSGGCFLSAGHCSISSSQIIEFNVPASNANGSTNPSDPDDQYPIDNASVQGGDFGLGNDWAYFGCFDNSNTNMSPLAVQGDAYTVPSSQPAANGQDLTNIGYGLDFNDPTRSQTQQIEDGIYDTINATRVFYNSLDTEGGNSGSPIYITAGAIPVAIHTNGGCTTTPGVGSNSGTRIDNAGLQNALANPQGICAALGNCPGEGNCYVSNGSPGCSNTDCCSSVCSADPFCCNNTWDQACANQAASICGNCGDSAAGSCFINNGSPGCNDGTCCQDVCEVDPFCCNSSWDSVCADSAENICADCDGDVLQANLGAPDGGDTIFGEGTLDPNAYKAAGFTTPIDYALECVLVDLDFTDATQIGGGFARVSIWTGTTVPTTEIQVLESPPQGTGVGVYNFLSEPPLELIQGTRYWLRVESGSTTGTFRWRGGTLDPTGVASHDGYIFNGNPSTTRNRFRITAVDLTPANDTCADATPIFNGVTPYTNEHAASDAPRTAGCVGNDRFNRDIFYTYVATFDGDIRVSTCDSTFDNVLAVYDGCSCPLDPADELACGDQSCGSSAEVVVPVTDGNCYLIRVGGWSTANASNFGSGEIVITKAFEECTDDPANGPCGAPNGTPGCRDQECCNLVCAVDPFLLRNLVGFRLFQQCDREL